MQLQYLADKNDISEIKGNVTFIAVSSDKLLQDKSKLRCTLRSVFGKRLHVVDAKEQMDKLYKEFENVLSQAIEDTQKTIDVVRRENGEDERLRAVEKRLSELCKLHKEDISDSCETRDKLMWSESTLSRYLSIHPFIHLSIQFIQGKRNLISFMPLMWTKFTLGEIFSFYCSE